MRKKTEYTIEHLLELKSSSYKSQVTRKKLDQETRNSYFRPYAPNSVQSFSYNSIKEAVH